ncbi:MAG: hypothetical protein IKA22_00810, partial [Lentisphaeria bacterium]|nr:hypothetical protein [Lentisphaeria bacterium]
KINFFNDFLSYSGVEFPLLQQNQLTGYKQKIKQPFFDTDGVTPLEGTIVNSMYPGRRDDFIQEFLQTIPNQVKVSKDRLYTEKDFEYVGK